MPSFFALNGSTSHKVSEQAKLIIYGQSNYSPSAPHLRDKQGLWLGKSTRDLAEMYHTGTSLEVQWLRLHTLNAGDPGSIPVQGTRSQMLQ